MKKVARTALLVSGSEERHARQQVLFSEYLVSIGVDVRMQNYAKAQVILESINSAVTDTPDDGILLIAFYGHGSPKGWESASRFGSVTYRKIIDAISSVKLRVQFVNTTCYGHY